MITAHASARAQQRCIPPVVDLWLDQFGEEDYDGRGGIRRFFSRRSITAMKRELGAHFVEFNMKWLNAYCVESTDDSVTITRGWRNKRLRRR